MTMDEKLAVCDKIFAAKNAASQHNGADAADSQWNINQPVVAGILSYETALLGDQLLNRTFSHIRTYVWARCCWGQRTLISKGQFSKSIAITQ